MNSLACPAQAVTALIHFAGKTALDIEGMGKERLTALWKAQAIATPADLYRLTDLQLENVLGLHPQFAGKLLMGIGASKFTTLPRLLVGLGVEGIGQAMSKALAVAFHYDAMAIFHAKAEDFMKVPGWDKTRSRAMERYCAVNYEALMDLLNQGLSWPVHRPMPTEAVLPLDGKTVVVTGRFDGLSRDALITYLQTHGATVASRVGKSTYTVLVGQKPTVTKLTTANALAIPTLSLADFIAQHHLPGVFHD